MHPLPQIDGCSCTYRTCTNKGHDIEILGVLNATFFLILRSAIAPPSSTGPAQSVLWWGKELQVREKFLSCIAFKPFWRNFRKGMGRRTC